VPSPKTRRRPAARRRSTTTERVTPINLEPKYNPAETPSLTAEIPVAVKGTGRKISQAKAVIPVAVKRQRRGRKTNLTVVPLVDRPVDANPITGIVHAAIDVEQHTLDLGVEMARPVFEVIGQVAEFVFGPPRAEDVGELTACAASAKLSSVPHS
jgi:hypothetical protein